MDSRSNFYIDRCVFIEGKEVIGKSYTDHGVSSENLITLIRQSGVISEPVLEAFRNVARHNFVTEALWHKAYADMTLPTSDGQTISQPTIVARMTELLNVQKGMKVLEIGTGSGYQAAILAQLTHSVFTIERISSLAVKARQKFKDLGINTIICREGDGTKGIPDKAPFDRIIVTAGAPVVPESLLEQLAIGGILVIPTGPREGQILERYTKFHDKIIHEQFEPLLFVPLIGENGWSPDQ